jgi:hypothetical protein
MDHLIHFGRRKRTELKPVDCISRYLCVKHSQWRGHYRRILCITPKSIVTQSPERGLPVTNVYDFCGDSDVESIVLGRTGQGDDLEFVVTARQDKKARRTAAFMGSTSLLIWCMRPTEQVQAHQVHLQAQESPAHRPVPMHCCRWCTWSLPARHQSARVSYTLNLPGSTLVG